MVCWFTKFVISVPLPNASTETVADAMMKELLLKFGTPSQLVSDRASTFTSEAFRAFCRKLEIQQHLAIPYHSKGNGATERTFRTFHNMVSKHVNKTHTDWDQILPYMTFVYNTTVHDTTGETPFFLIFGRDPVFAIDKIMHPSPPKEGEEVDIPAWKEHLITTLRLARKEAAERSLKEQEARQKVANVGAKGSKIVVGDRVFFQNHKSKANLSRKMVLPWIGEFEVISIDHPKAVIKDLEHPSKPERTVHLNQIKKILEREDPGAALKDSDDSISEVEAIKEELATAQPEINQAPTHQIEDNIVEDICIPHAQEVETRKNPSRQRRRPKRFED